MALHLITGYAGQEHVTSADQGAYNMGTYGEGEFVLDRGSKFAATVVTNNQINIANGEALMQGRFIKLPVGTTESVTIDNGTSGMKRKDLIVLRYTKNASTGVESVELAVKKGTPSSGTPSDPSVTTGNITDGTDLVNEMKLYRVNLDSLNITAVDTLFSLKTTMVEYMDNYQLPIATDARLGGVKIGDGINVDEAGLINLKKATDSQLGGVKGGANVIIDTNGVLSVATGGKGNKGVLSVGDYLSVNNGEISAKLASTSQYGVVLLGRGLQKDSNNYTGVKLTSNSYHDGRLNESGDLTIAANKMPANPVRFKTNSSLTNNEKNVVFATARFNNGCFFVPIDWDLLSADVLQVTGYVFNTNSYSITINSSTTVYIFFTYIPY